MTKTPITLQDLRRRLYVKAKAEPSWRFWGLYAHVCKRETLRAAYELAKRNDGARAQTGRHSRPSKRRAWNRFSTDFARSWYSGAIDPNGCERSGSRKRAERFASFPFRRSATEWSRVPSN